MGAGNENPANLRYRKEFPAEAAENVRSIFTVGHFDETCFSIDRTRPADGACCFPTFAAETMPTLTLSRCNSSTVDTAARSTTAGRNAPTARRVMNRRR
jgi:hypothetical protein